MIESPPPEILDALRRMGLLATSTDTCGERLTGGVSSDIWRIDLPAGPICVKRALAKLRVAADWQAPVERNRYEARWMQRANAAVPGCRAATAGPGRGDRQHSRCSSCRRTDYPLWKTQLRDGDADPAFAAQVARRAGRASTPPPPPIPSIAADFPTDTIFYDIRLEPYLLATARAHPDLAAPLHGSVATTAGQQACAGARRCQPEEHPARPGTARCSWMRSAPGGAIRRSTWRSASTTCC